MYSKKNLKNQAMTHSKKLIFEKYLAKDVLCFKKLISPKRNPPRITASKKSMNKYKFQAQVLISARTFYFIFSYEGKLFTRYSLLFTCHLLLFTRYFLPITRYFLISFHYFLLATCYFLLITRYFLLLDVDVIVFRSDFQIMTNE